MARKTFIVPQEFPELTHANGKKLLKEMGQTSQYWRDRYVGAWKWWTGILGMNAESFDNMTLASAVLNHCHWDGSGAGYGAGAQSTSRNNIEAIPGGELLLNVAASVFQGRFIGQGTSIGLNGNAQTELVYDHARWMDPRAVRALILSTNWGTSTYLESLLIDNIRLNGKGPGWKDPKYTQVGMALRMMGETAVVGRVYTDNCNGAGVWVNGAGPGKIQTLTSFDNNGPGLWYTNDKAGGATGNSLGMLQVDTLSCDNNECQLKVDAGGAMQVNYIKSETGLSASRGKPNKQSTVIEANGWVNINVRSITDAVVGASGVPFVFNSLANKSRVKIDSYAQVAAMGVNHGRSALVADIRAKKAYRLANPDALKFDCIDIDWRASGNSTKLVMNGSELAGEAFGGKGRMGIASTFAGYNYAAGTPVFDPTKG